MNKLFLQKLLLPFFMAWTFCISLYAQSQEWYGFIPVCMMQEKAYFLLRQQSNPSDNKDILVPPVGGCKPVEQEKNDFLQQQLASIICLNSSINLPLFFDKLPYVFYQDKSDENHHQNCLRWWWPSSFYQNHEWETHTWGTHTWETSAKSNLSTLVTKKIDTDFFGTSLEESAINETATPSTKYTIYFVPIKNRDQIEIVDPSSTHWYSIQQMRDAQNQIESSFLEKLMTMFTTIGESQSNNDDAPNITIARDIRWHFNHFDR